MGHSRVWPGELKKLQGSVLLRAMTDKVEVLEGPVGFYFLERLAKN